MSFHRSILVLRARHGGGPIELAYQHRVSAGTIRSDANQLSLSRALDSLYSSLNKGVAIADEDVDIAARYYDANDSSKSRWKSLLSSLASTGRRGGCSNVGDYGESAGVGSSNFVGVANAALHSFWNSTTMRTNNNLLHSGGGSGIYIHGSVGTGKSMLMDLFYSVCADGLTLPMPNVTKGESNSTSTTNTPISTPANNDAAAAPAAPLPATSTVSYDPIKIRHKRLHFHEFMLHTHQTIHAYKLKHPRSDPIPHVAATLAREARLLCFDEMASFSLFVVMMIQITDIADAMIIKRLFTILLDLGVVIVTTSNRPPSGLYEGGINRSVFLPFIDTLYERMEVIEMGGGHDYRKDNGLDLASLSMSSDSLPSYMYPSDCSSTRRILERWMAIKKGRRVESDSALSPAAAGVSSEVTETIIRGETIPVAMGRTLRVERANKRCGRFTFDELCARPLGAADYIAISHRFGIVLVENVPQLGGQIYNEARRFVTLVDALYEARTTLVIAADVPREELFVGFDAAVETHDGDEEIALDDDVDGGTVTALAGNDNTYKRSHNRESLVIGEGGSSSSSSTTLIRTTQAADENGGGGGGEGVMEWSATGRIGVSLAQLSAVREVSFSFRRAESRLAEMASASWGR